jgi:hypothetical protein
VLGRHKAGVLVPGEHFFAHDLAHGRRHIAAGDDLEAPGGGAVAAILLVDEVAAAKRRHLVEHLDELGVVQPLLEDLDGDFGKFMLELEGRGHGGLRDGGAVVDQRGGEVVNP